jgi:multidrug transporter EmrE-like cation transporter
MKTSIVLLIAIVSQLVGDVFLTRGMKAIATSAGPAGDAALSVRLVSYLRLAIDAAMNPEVLIGTGCLIVFFVLYSAALSWADLSFVLPATAFGYVLHVAAGAYLLDETVSPARWAGSAVITLGVLFISRSGDRTVFEGQGGAPE